MKKILLCLFLILSSILDSKLYSQCTPAAADDCENANVMCSLSEVNGYCCQNPSYSNPTGCSPLCPNGGGPHNTGWWAFVSQGGLVHISIAFSNCSVNGKGVQVGIWGDCNCGESIVCNPACNGPGGYILSADLAPCKTYYLFVDGCSGDVCDFCLTTTSGLPPILSPLGQLMGDRDVCVGACNIPYSISVEGSCQPTYEWNLDGDEVGSGNGGVTLDFPQEGDFVLCVTAYIGNPQSGSICDQSSLMCITIKAKYEVVDRIGPTWNICHEDIPFNWHGIIVDSSGEYRQHFTDRVKCCPFDSVRQFVVLDAPKKGVKYYVGCDSSDVYIDPTTRQIFSTCQFQKLVSLPNSTRPHRCDSSYLLNAVFLNYYTLFRELCDSGRLHIDARVIDRSLSCGNDSAYMSTIRYRWYLKSDSTQTTLDTQSYLVVDRKDDYCLEVLIHSEFGDQKKKCSFSFCEEHDESEHLPYEVCMVGNFIVKNGDSTHYSIDTVLKSTVMSQIWSVEGGQILTINEGKDTSNVLVLWDDTSSVRMICYQYSNECGLSSNCCMEVKSSTSLEDFSVKPEDIKIIPNPVNQKFNIQGPNNLEIISLNLLDQMGHTVTKWTELLSNEFDVSTYSDGIYFLLIQTDRGMVSKKIIIIK